jgi:hypothetical protein
MLIVAGPGLLAIGVTATGDTAAIFATLYHYVAGKPPAIAYITDVWCQHNIYTRKLLFMDGQTLPGGARTEVLSYQVEKQDTHGWTHGLCRVEVLPLR